MPDNSWYLHLKNDILRIICFALCFTGTERSTVCPQPSPSAYIKCVFCECHTPGKQQHARFLVHALHRFLHISASSDKGAVSACIAFMPPLVLSFSGYIRSLPDRLLTCMIRAEASQARSYPSSISSTVLSMENCPRT